MSDILFISSFHPYARGIIGAGEGICGNNLEKFLSRGDVVDVVVISPICQKNNSFIVEQCNKYRTYDSNFLNKIESLIFNLKKGSFFAPWFFTRVNKKVISYLNELLKDNSYDFIWIEFPSSLGFVTYLEHPDIRYCAHDIVTQKISRSILKRMFFPLTKYIELSNLNKIKKIVVLSDKDRLLLNKTGCVSNIVVDYPQSFPVGDVVNSTPIEDIVKLFAGKRNIVFFGNMRRAENHWSILLFLIYIFIFKMGVFGKVDFWIIGISPRMTLKVFSKFFRNVHITGAVSDPYLAFKKSDLCIAPILFGAGVKIKVLQMLEAGSRVIATKAGAEGIKNNPLLEVTSFRGISDRIGKLLND